MVAELARITRPGGWVAFEEVDWVSWVCDPIHPAWTRLIDINGDIWRKRGMDVNVGRRLPRLLHDAGLTDIQCRSHAPMFNNSDTHQYLLLAFSEINRAEMIAKGYVTEVEYNELTASLRAHLEDPGTFVTWSLFYQAWEKYRSSVAYERDGQDRLSQYLRSLIGIGTGGLDNRLVVRDESLPESRPRRVSAIFTASALRRNTDFSTCLSRRRAWTRSSHSPTTHWRSFGGSWVSTAS